MSPTSQTFPFFLGRTAEQKGKKERGLGGLKSKLLCFSGGSRSEIAVVEFTKQAIAGIFALLQLKLERFHFSLIKRKPKQKIFQFLLKEKMGAKKIKKKY